MKNRKRTKLRLIFTTGASWYATKCHSPRTRRGKISLVTTHATGLWKRFSAAKESLNREVCRWEQSVGFWWIWSAEISSYIKIHFDSSISPFEGGGGGTTTIFRAHFSDPVLRCKKHPRLLIKGFRAHPAFPEPFLDRVLSRKIGHQIDGNISVMVLWF